VLLLCARGESKPLVGRGVMFVCALMRVCACVRVCECTLASVCVCVRVAEASGVRAM
jgi:hypothetical protein